MRDISSVPSREKWLKSFSVRSVVRHAVAPSNAAMTEKISDAARG